MNKSWNYVRLDELCDIRVGRTPRRDTPKYWGGTAVWVTISELSGGVISESKEHVSDLAVKEIMPEPIPTGTLLFSFKLSIGKMGIAGCPLYTNEAIAALVIRDNNRLSRDFLKYALEAVNHSIGANKAVLGKVLNKEQVSAIQIPLLPLTEQERIVRLLDEAESLRATRERTNVRMEQFVPALFQEMFGDVVENEKNWNKNKFSELGQLDRGKSKHRPRDAAFLYGGSYPFVQTGDIANSNGQITSYSQTYSEDGLAQSKLWPAGTLCITIAANIGKTAILTFPACFPDSIVGFTPDNSLVDIEFIRQWLVTIESDLEAIAPQSAQKNINLGILRELPVPLPPLALQREFAARVEEARGVQSAQARSTERVEALYQSMLSRAFKGEL